MSKNTLRFALLLAATAASSFGQAAQGGNYNPVNSMWAIEVIIYSIFGAIVTISILWHCMQAALGSHDGMPKIASTVIYGSIGFGAVYIVSHLVSGSQAPI